MTDVPTPAPTSGPWTVPNLISVVRLALVPVFVWLVVGADEPLWAAVLLGALGATDWVDGWFARRFDQVSELGKILDPTADRLMLLVAVIVIAAEGAVPWWFAILTLVREGGVSIAALVMAALGARRIDVTWWGKTGTFLLMFSYPLFLASSSDWFLADAALVAAWVCGIPGLAISWYSAAGYVPLAMAAVTQGRATTTAPTDDGIAER
ncbi:MAG TPA: CDP-alcohol phosphatidyltransferase family protein [Acidimicrobiales bacterium]|nr:CDP-alcohol phosphatidyltransferase family protein [Acidimicrobiales bacterium]